MTACLLVARGSTGWMVWLIWHRPGASQKDSAYLGNVDCGPVSEEGPVARLPGAPDGEQGPSDSAYHGTPRRFDGVAQGHAIEQPMVCPGRQELCHAGGPGLGGQDDGPHGRCLAGVATLEGDDGLVAPVAAPMAVSSFFP